MKKIQRVYIIHDYFYANLDLIPSRSFDPKEVYIHTEYDISEFSSDNVIFNNSYQEALEQL